MSRVTRRLKRWISFLELHEILGLGVSLVAIIIFFAYSTRLDQIMGISGYHWKALDNVVGVYQNSIPWLLTLGLIIFFVLLIVLRRATHQFLQHLAYLIRVLIAFLIMMAIYKTVNFYIAVFNPFDKDIVLQHIDRFLFFGKLPSEWLEPLICKPLTALFGSAYVSWFIFTYGTIVLMMTRGRKATIEYTFTAIFTFYVGYFVYLLVPAIGPVFTVKYAHSVGGISALFAQDNAFIARDCFPSLHTGISIVMLVHVWRHHRRFTWLYGPVAALIILATLYLRFHYGIDVIAGAALAFASCQLCPLMLRDWEKLRRKWRPESEATTTSPPRRNQGSERQINLAN